MFLKYRKNTMPPFQLIRISFIMLLATAYVLTACQKKAVPVITERETPPPVISRTIYPPKETVAPDTLAGKRIFTNRCGRCHALPLPDQFSVKRWDNILPVMIPRARLNNEESLHVRTWLLAHASQ
jgi:hypothetical protein